MKIVVTGSHGQLGTELMQQGHAEGHDMLGLDAAHLDITDAAAVSEAIQAQKPDVVINAAAYTAVDKAEDDAEAAFAVNRDGPTNLAKVCAKASIPLVHMSTDYVFDGSKQGGYVEDEPIAPLGIYGQSKAEGEAAVREACAQHLILRTSWVFSAHGNNFVKTMLRLGAERYNLAVVADQQGKPTSAAELARVIFMLLPDAKGHWGTYHLAQPEVTNWHGFAAAIFAEAEHQGEALKLKNLNAIQTSDYPTPAKRPANSELDCTKIEATFGVKIGSWRESLSEVVAALRQGDL